MDIPRAVFLREVSRIHSILNSQYSLLVISLSHAIYLCVFVCPYLMVTGEHQGSSQFDRPAYLWRGPHLCANKTFYDHILN